MGFKDISAPRVVCTGGNANLADGERLNGEACIRFPFFDQKFGPEKKGKFVDLYEKSGQNKPRSLSDYYKYNYVFSSFNDPLKPFMTPGDCEFWRQVIEIPATKMVLLDKHFDACNLWRVLDVLRRRQFQDEFNVTVFTAKKDAVTTIKEKADRFKDLIGSLNNTSVAVLKLDKEDSDLIHDRFALIDNFIWHFGAAACGMHGSLHAYTGPWFDIGSAFESLTNDLRKGATSIL